MKKSIFDLDNILGYKSPFKNKFSPAQIDSKIYIKEVIGPKEVSIGEEYLYVISAFGNKDYNFPNNNFEIKWGYAFEDKSIVEIDKKNKKENAVLFKIPNNDGKKITIFAWLNNSGIYVSTSSLIVSKKFSDRKVFFREISQTIPTLSKLNNGQINAINEILNKKELAYPNLDTRQFAYILGTVYHETARTFLPIKEAPNKTEDWRKDNFSYFPYYGRGYVQLTHKDNYQKIGDLFDVDLISAPDTLLNNHNLSLIITFEGMANGWFRKKRKSKEREKLETYFNEFQTDWVNARLIINGFRRKADGKYETEPDKAKEIAEISIKFYNALLKANIPKYLDQHKQDEFINFDLTDYSDEILPNNLP